MDLATNSDHQYALKDGPDHTIEHGSVSSCPDQLEDLLEKITDREHSDLVVVIEASGMSWFPIAVFFQRNEVPVYRVKAQQSERFREFLDNHTKTDELDADALGRLYYMIPDQLHEVWFPEGQLHNLRRWAQRREDYVQKKTAEKNRFTSLLKWTLPGLEGKLNRFSGQKMEKIMAHAIDYNWVCSKMGKRRFIEWARRRNGSVSEDRLEQLFEIVQQARKTYEDSEYDPRDRKREALEMLDELDHLRQKVEVIEDRMNSSYKNSLPDKPVDSVPGVAWKTAAVVKSYLGDGGRFENLSKAEAFVGSIPGTNQSGDTDKQGTDIRKDGPSMLKKFLYMAADTARTLDPQIAQTYHDQMVKKGKVHTQAVCKCVNKLLRRIMRVLRDGKEYELRDNDGNPVSKKEARELIEEQYTVPEEVRKQRRNKAG